MLRLYLYARVRFFAHFLHTRPRVQQAPGVPCALSVLGRTVLQGSGETRREIVKLCLQFRSPDERSDIRDGVRVVPDIAALIRATDSWGTILSSSLRAQRSNP